MKKKKKPKPPIPQRGNLDSHCLASPPLGGRGLRGGLSGGASSLKKGITFPELIELMLAHDKMLAKEEREERKKNKLIKRKLKLQKSLRLL